MNEWDDVLPRCWKGSVLFKAATTHLPEFQDFGAYNANRADSQLLELLFCRKEKTLKAENSNKIHRARGDQGGSVG